MKRPFLHTLAAVLALASAHPASSRTLCEGITRSPNQLLPAETAVLAWSRTVAIQLLTINRRNPASIADQLALFDEVGRLQWLSESHAMVSKVSNSTGHTLALAIGPNSCIATDTTAGAPTWKVEHLLLVYQATAEGFIKEGAAPETVALTATVRRSENMTGLVLSDPKLFDAAPMEKDRTQSLSPQSPSTLPPSLPPGISIGRP